MKEYACGFAFDRLDHNTVLLIRKLRPKEMYMRLNGVGGKVEEGESPLQCMHREFQEEVGLTGGNWRHFATLLCPLYNEPARIWFFTCDNLDIYQAVQMEDERPMRVDTNFVLPDTAIDNLNWLIPMALSSSKEWPYHIVENSLPQTSLRLD